MTNEEEILTPELVQHFATIMRVVSPLSVNGIVASHERLRAERDSLYTRVFILAQALRAIRRSCLIGHELGGEGALAELTTISRCADDALSFADAKARKEGT